MTLMNAFMQFVCGIGSDRFFASSFSPTRDVEIITTIIKTWTRSSRRRSRSVRVCMRDVQVVHRVQVKVCENRSLCAQRVCVFLRSLRCCADRNDIPLLPLLSAESLTLSPSPFFLCLSFQLLVFLISC